MRSWREHFVEQARYQGWANDLLFAALDRLTETERRADLGLFFRGIHHSVDHLLVVNRLWRERLSGAAPSVNFRAISQPDWGALKSEFRAETSRMADWLAAQPEDWFAGEASYASSDGRAWRMPVADVLAHMMFHLVHHRGQVSAAVTRLGGDAPEMDFLYYLRARTPA
jgi:uncharacterized damage-inducible protein DinB